MLRAILTLRCPPIDGWIRTLRSIWSIWSIWSLVDAGDER